MKFGAQNHVVALVEVDDGPRGSFGAAEISNFERFEFQRIHTLKDADPSRSRDLHRARAFFEIAGLRESMGRTRQRHRIGHGLRVAKRVDVRPNEIRKGVTGFQLSLVVGQRPWTRRRSESAGYD